MTHSMKQRRKRIKHLGWKRYQVERARALMLYGRARLYLYYERNHTG